MSSGQPSFEAHCFYSDLGTRVMTGSVFFTGRDFCFQSSDFSADIPFERLVVKLGEGDDERMFFSDSRQPGLQIVTPDQSLLLCRDHPQIAQIRKCLEAGLTRRELWMRSRLIVYFVAAGVLILWLGMIVTSAMVRSIVARVPKSWEQEIGEAALKELRQEMTFVEDTNRTAQLRQLAQPLLSRLPSNGYNYEFYIVEDDDPNAFALPGGHIIVLTGLLKLADRPEQVLGVIAHEVAHVTQRHAIRSQISSAGPVLIFQTFFGRRGGVMGVLVGGSALVVSQGFSQEYEIEADDVGWQYLVDSRVDPRGMAEMFHKLAAYDADHENQIDLPQALSSHPAMRKRIARLDNKWNKLPMKSEFIELPSLTKASR